MFDFLSIKKTVESLQKQHDELCSELQSVESKITQTRQAPVNKADLSEIVAAWVDKSAQGFPVAVSAHMAKHYRTGSAVAANVGFFSLVKDSADGLNAGAMDGVMCAVFGNQIKAAIVSSIDGMDWPGEGLPVAKRELEIQRLEKIAQKIRSNIDNILQGAHEAGVTLK